MSLLESADSLVERIRRFTEMRIHAREAAGFHTRADQLLRAASLVDEVREQTAALQAAGVITDGGIPLNGLSDRAITLSEAFKSDPGSILSLDPPLDVALLNPLQDVVRRKQQSLSEAWQEYIGSIVGALPEDLLRALEGYSDLRGTISAIRAIHARGENIASKLPANAAALRTAVTEAQQVQSEKTAKLEQLRGIPPEVVEFLSRVGVRNATLNDVSENIREWLEHANLLEKLSVTWR